MYLQDTEVETLEEAVRNHNNSFFRNRCQCILYSHRGVPVKQLSAIYNTRTRTIYTWFNRWQTMGLIGLTNLPGQGRKPTLDIENQAQVQQALALVQENSVNIDKAAQGLSIELGRPVSKGMLKRLISKKDTVGGRSENT